MLFLFGILFSFKYEISRKRKNLDMSNIKLLILLYSFYKEGGRERERETENRVF